MRETVVLLVSFSKQLTIIGVPLHNLTVLNAVGVPDMRLFAAPGRRLSQLCALGKTVAPLFCLHSKALLTFILPFFILFSF